MNKIVILTGDEQRHHFFRKRLGLMSELNILRSYCESPIAKEKLLQGNENTSLRQKHLGARTQTELDFFGLFNHHCQDHSNPRSILRGEINSEEVVSEIIQLQPDYIVSYGCSIIKSPLIQEFKNKFINLHLGLSPYYRGSGTNFWPLVNEEPQFVGATFMHIDEGIDTGRIIHQIRARFSAFDTVHTIGNRLIADAAEEIGEILKKGIQEPLSLPDYPEFQEKLYRNRDFTESSVEQMYANFSSGMVDRYLNRKREIDLEFPLISNQAYCQA